MTGCVPDLKLERRLLDLQEEGAELHADCDFVIVLKFVVTDPVHEARLSDSAVADHDQLEQVVVLGDGAAALGRDDLIGKLVVWRVLDLHGVSDLLWGQVSRLLFFLPLRVPGGHNLKIINMMKFAAALTQVMAQFTVPITRHTDLVTPRSRLHHMLRHENESKLAMRLAEDPEYLGNLAISDIDLSNSGNVAYTGPVFFGTPLQTGQDSEFLYDTGSGYLFVSDSTCSTCSTQYYSQVSGVPSTKFDLTRLGYGDA